MASSQMRSVNTGSAEKNTISQNFSGHFRLRLDKKTYIYIKPHTGVCFSEERIAFYRRAIVSGIRAMRVVRYRNYYIFSRIQLKKKSVNTTRQHAIFWRNIYEHFRSNVTNKIIECLSCEVTLNSFEEWTLFVCHFFLNRLVKGIKATAVELTVVKSRLKSSTSVVNQKNFFSRVLQK